ncbi:MAG: hypothetical protein JW953_01625 [Anaerolineae bacterium]|nr:hypothetical protein [Anaerolineae bacterium]
MTAPFRIRRPEARGAQPVAAAAPADSFSFYLDRLLKMIPAEVVSLYIVGMGLIPAEQVTVLTVWFVVCLVGLFVIRIYGTADPAESLPPDWTHIIISAVAFLIWVYSIGGPFAAWGFYVPWLGSLLVLAWTFFVPIFYKGPQQ